MAGSKRWSGANSNWSSFARRGYQALLSDRRVRMGMVYLLLTVAIMQSFNQVARTWIPLGWLGQPKSVGALSEALGCAAISIGLSVVSIVMTEKRARAGHLPIAFISGTLLMMAPFMSKNLVVSFALYFSYMVVFEISFMASMNELLRNAKQDDVSGLMVLFYGSAFGSMTIMTVLLAVTADRWGLPKVTIALAAMGGLAGVLLSLAKVQPRRWWPNWRGAAKGVVPEQDGLG